jgi:hypothetical protein
MDITVETLPYAQAAIRDILYLYVDMVESYGGFGHNLDTGTFSPAEFVNSKVITPDGYTLGLDEELLHTGSAIAILCAISDCWDDQGEISLWWPKIKSAKSALDAGQFKHLPEIEKAFVLAFEGDLPLFTEQLQAVYQKHVLSYFKRLSES